MDKTKYQNQHFSKTGKAVHDAKKDLKKHKTYENAVDLQRAERNHKDYRKITLQLVE